MKKTNKKPSKPAKDTNVFLWIVMFEVYQKRGNIWRKIVTYLIHNMENIKIRYDFCNFLINFCQLSLFLEIFFIDKFSLNTEWQQYPLGFQEAC